MTEYHASYKLAGKSHDAAVKLWKIIGEEHDRTPVSYDGRNLFDIHRDYEEIKNGSLPAPKRKSRKSLKPLAIKTRLQTFTLIGRDIRGLTATTPRSTSSTTSRMSLPLSLSIPSVTTASILRPQARKNSMKKIFPETLDISSTKAGLCPKGLFSRGRPQGSRRQK